MLGSPLSLEYPIRTQQERRRERQAESPGCLEINDKLERCGLFHWKVAGSLSAKDSVDVVTGSSSNRETVCRICDESTGGGFGMCEKRWQSVTRGKLGEATTVGSRHGVRQHDDGLCALAAHQAKRTIKL